MSVQDWIVVASATALTALLAWYFFGPKRAGRAEMSGGVQVVTVTVKGGYSPELIQVKSGTPVRLVFDRQEAGDCSSRVVFPEFKINQSLPAFSRTAVEFAPREPGEYAFACGMNMLHGRLRVVGDTGIEAEGAVTADRGSVGADGAHTVGRAETRTRATEASVVGEGGGHWDALSTDAQDAEAQERAAEVADLTRRVILGAVLTAPVLFAVMATQFFSVTWVPESLLNHWVQLALITPVMFYTGWPIHRTGWLALSHRTADMNSLITLGTIAAYGYSLLVTVSPRLCLPGTAREVYFEAVGVIITLILLGRLLEARAKAGTGEAIRALLGLQARTARVVRDGAEDRDPDRGGGGLGDEVVVRPGEKMPVDAGAPRARQRSTSRWSPASRSRSPNSQATPSSAPPSTAPGRCASVRPRSAPTRCWPRSSAWCSRPRRSKAPIQRLADTISGYFVPAVIAHRDRHLRGLVHSPGHRRRSPSPWSPRSRC